MTYAYDFGKEYEQATARLHKAVAVYEQARTDYRAKRIDGEAFLDARTAYFDVLYEDYERAFEQKDREPIREEI